MSASMPVVSESFLTPEPWTQDAACREVAPDVFFPGKGDHHAAAAARAVCGVCPVIAECLAYALRTRETLGVWGGKTAQERKKLLANAPHTCRDCETSIEERWPFSLYCDPCAADRRRRRYQA